MMLILAQTPAPANAPTVPIPPMDAMGLPSHWAIFLTLYHVTFVLHLLFMNFSLGGAIVCLVNDLRSFGSTQAEYLTDLNRRIFAILPVTISFAITFGVAPLLFVQVLYGQFFYTSTILIGLPWMAVIGVLVVVFYLVYLVRYRPTAIGPGRRLIRIALASLVVAGFATIAFMLTSNAVWSISPEHWLARAGGRHALWPAERHFLPRYLHNLIGGTAMACLLTAGVARVLGHRGVTDEYWMVRTVRGFLLAAAGLTVLQMLDGAMMLVLLRPVVRDAMLLSPSNLHVWGWRVGVLAGIFAVIWMIRGVRSPSQGRWAWLALAFVTVTLGGMSMARQAVRELYLRDYFRLTDWGHARPGQESAFIAFLVSFVVALAVVGWMLWLTWHLPSRPATNGRGFTAEPPAEGNATTAHSADATP